MSRSTATLIALAVATLVALSPAPSGADDLSATVTAMARIGRAYAPQFSPDGSRIAFITDLSGMPQVWVVPATGGYPEAVTGFDDPVIAVSWSPKSDWLAVSVAPGGGLNTQIYVVRSNGSGLRRITDGGKENNWLGKWTRDGKYLTLSSSRRDPGAMDSYLADPVEGKLTLVAENPGVGDIADVSADNRLVLVERTKSRGDNDLYVVEVGSKRETRVTPHVPPAQFGGGDLAPDGGTVYLTSNDGRDLMGFGRVRLGPTAKPGTIEILAERSDAELDGYALNDQGTVAVLAWNVAGRSELELIDLKTGKRSAGLRPAAELVNGLIFSRDGNLLAFSSSGSASPSNLWVHDFRTKKTWPVTRSSHAGVDLAALARPELVRFLAHDGIELSGWLYEPAEFKKPGPVVLSFHGGPEGQERPAFRSDYQALLSQGIAVFAPNVRGSAGFGKKFVNLDNGALRANGVRDIKACVDHVVSKGFADPKRMGIMGGSYGGYMTMAGLTEFPELFAAGADLFGIVNFETFFQHTEPWMAAISTVEYGDPATQAAMLRSLSPIHKLDRVKAATLVIHGANDTNVPVIEAEQVVEKLKARGVEVKYVSFPDEGHGWRKTTNRITAAVEVTRFFASHLGASPTAAK